MTTTSFLDIGALVGRKQLQVREDASATRSKAKGRKDRRGAGSHRQLGGGSWGLDRQLIAGGLTIGQRWGPQGRETLNERQATIPRRARAELRTVYKTSRCHSPITSRRGGGIASPRGGYHHRRGVHI